MITDEERQVVDLLRAVRAPLSNADVARAVVRGRRRRRRRGAAVVSAVTVLVLALGVGAVVTRRILTGPEPVATAACRVVVLPNLPGRNLKAVLDLDPSGRYAVGSYHLNRGVSREYGYVRWDGAAEPEGLDLDAYWGAGSQALTVLPDGAVLAGTEGNSGPGILLRDGAPTRLSPPLGYNTAVPGWITPDGQVAGWAKKTFLPEYAATVWPPGGEHWRNAATAVPNFKPLAVGATGVTVGVRWDPDRYVVRYPDGVERDLAVPDGVAVHAGVVQVTGDRAVGTAMERGDGESPGLNTWLDGGGPVAVRWNLTTGAADRIPGADGEVAPGVSADGTVVFADAEGRGMLRAPTGRAVRLPMPEGRRLVGRLWTSDDGRTVLGALRVPGTADVVEAVRWRC